MINWFVFIGLLFGGFVGARHMWLLLNNPDIKINESNIRLAFWGTILGLVSLWTNGIWGTLASYSTGLCFGLIGVNYIFEKRK